MLIKTLSDLVRRFAQSRSILFAFGAVSGICMVATAAAQGPKRASAIPALDIRALMQPAPQSAAFRDPGYFVWCGTLIKGEDGKYHLFYSRWKLQYGPQSWVTSSEIAHAVGDSPTGPFHFHDVTLPPRGAKYWDGMVTHNPTVQKFGSKYYLYYMGNAGNGVITAKLNYTHRNHQRVGVAVADSPYGPWRRFDHPMVDVSADPAAPDSLCTTNPSLTRGRDGRYYLLYKAVGQQQPLPFGGPVVHLMAISNSPTGPFVKQLKPLFTLPGNNFPFEDPFIWFDSKRDRYFAILKDNHGVTTGTHQSSLVLYESADASTWKPAEHSFIDSLDLKWVGKPVEHVKSMERPQLMFSDDGNPEILTVAISDGFPQTYNVRIPLAASPNIEHQ